MAVIVLAIAGRWIGRRLRRLVRRLTGRPAKQAEPAAEDPLLQRVRELDDRLLRGERTTVNR